jgi:hypothetical protein
MSIKTFLLSKNDHSKVIVAASLVAVLFLQVDGIKIEYLRYAHTIQFAWMIYALNVAACRIAHNASEREDIK